VKSYAYSSMQITIGATPAVATGPMAGSGRNGWWLQAWCPHCAAEIEYHAFGDPFRCWHCGREVEPTHECGRDEPWCDDYLMEVEDS
jgi:hypothetical protein